MSDTTHLTTDFLIVGQGLAGTLAAHFLIRAGKKVHVIDDDYPRAATKVAASIINPVTGRRYVKSWRVDELIPQARTTYRELEQLLGVQLFHPRPVLRTLFNAREENDWQARAHDPAYQTYILPADQVDIGRYGRHTAPAFAYGELREGAQVEVGTLARHFRRYLRAKGWITETGFDHRQLELRPEGVAYRGIRAERILFCEGAKAKTNPYFSYLPYEGNKGEALITDIPGAGFEKILKHRVFVVPLADGTYWIGSTSDNFHNDDLPTEKGRNQLLEKLNQLLQLPYTLREHRAAIRPTVKDRRPLLGRHPDYPQLLIFNGLGTKGASLGPFWARHLCQVLLEDGPIDPQVNIDRFKLRPSK